MLTQQPTVCGRFLAALGCLHSVSVHLFERRVNGRDWVVVVVVVKISKKKGLEDCLVSFVLSTSHNIATG